MEKNKIINYCNSLGLDTIGFVKCREFNELKEFYEYRKKNNLENEFEEESIEKRINPKVYMEDGETIISIAFPYKTEEEKVDNGFSIYTKRLDYHKVLNSYLEKICKFINELGYEAMSFVDSNSLPERYIAYLGKVGFIGKNNMIITEKYGSFIFLGEIITNMKIETEENRFEEIIKYNECGKCNNCNVVCPTKAINIERKNCNICTSYITQKKELSDSELKLINNKIFGCDICQKICPYNKNIILSNIKEFEELDYMNEKDVSVYANINNKYFKENLVKTSCGWRGKNVIKRNAIIRAFNKGEDISVFKGDSPFINDIIKKLLEK